MATAIPILAVEPVIADSHQLVQCLRQLGHEVWSVATAAEAMALLRQEPFRWAVVAAEMAAGGQPLLARVRHVPTLERLAATGPPGDPEMEVQARCAGADVYLTRPVTAGALAGIFGATTHKRRRARHGIS